jgi:hypothetical protein
MSVEVRARISAASLGCGYMPSIKKVAGKQVTVATIYKSDIATTTST